MYYTFIPYKQERKGSRKQHKQHLDVDNGPVKAKQLEAQNVPDKEVDTVSDDKDAKNIISKGNHGTLPTTTCHHHLERGPYFFISSIMYNLL